MQMQRLQNSNIARATIQLQQFAYAKTVWLRDAEFKHARPRSSTAFVGPTLSGCNVHAFETIISLRLAYSQHLKACCRVLRLTHHFPQRKPVVALRTRCRTLHGSITQNATWLACASSAERPITHSTLASATFRHVGRQACLDIAWR